DEMCLSYLVYYPKTNLGGCVSSPSVGSIVHSMGIQELYPVNKKQNSLADIPNLEEKLLAKMLDNGTYEGLPINLGYMFKSVIAKKPERLANQSLYDIVMDPSTWTDTFVKSFQDVAMYGTHDLKCFNLHVKHVEGIQPTVKYPKFEAYEAP
ncbi:unnamed protein product, partial [Meganyctiphanes norvegica]